MVDPLCKAITSQSSPCSWVTVNWTDTWMVMGQETVYSGEKQDSKVPPDPGRGPVPKGIKSVTFYRLCTYYVFFCSLFPKGSSI